MKRGTPTLGQCATLCAGFPFRGSIVPDAEGDALVIQMKDVSRTAPPDWSNMIRTRLAGHKPFPFLQPDDILFVMRGGNYFAVHLAEVPEPAVAALHFFIIRPRDPARLLPAFLTWQLNHGPAQSYFQQAQAGSVQCSVRRADMEALPLVLPPVAEQRTLVRLAETCQRQQEALRRKIVNTTRLMDGIAADLFSRT